MRRWINFLSHLTILTILTSFAYRSGKSKDFFVPKELVGDKETVVHVAPENAATGDTYSVFLGKGYLGFKEALAFKESGGDYQTINTLGYIGKYQFGKGTLRLMGVLDSNAFLGNPVLQETVFKMNVTRNKWILRRDIKRFVGKKINGVVITESGIVAAAHLAGAGNVKKYLRSYGHLDFADAYGSSVAYYIKKFGGYDLSQVKAVHNPKVVS
ncbi:MAG: hypothetical protein AAF634_11285 [Bacteroidota bacterium]